MSHHTGASTSLPTRSGSLTTASSALDTGSDNSPLSSALQVADTLSDIGKALPFVAPAFVLLKIIIDIEQRAQEVDAKCNDLLERITFMLSHLPVLQKIEIMPSTRQVIDRMNDAIKGAAALIAAYRKQSRVARRLSISNREKFTQCAESLNTCCKDLLMSLQIHQSKQLDILTRAVPIDEDDAAAQTFVATHGGSVDAVLHDRELVKEFAQQQSLVMDDSVMEQLNANIADSVQQNGIRLEGILRDNVNTAIVDGLKSLVAELNAVEAEQKFKCVQCDKEFTNYTNGPKACSFHRGEYDSWSKHFPCCSTAHPCQFNTHRAKHHCDYPYGNFFPRARGVTGYVDTNEQWASVEDTNLETDDEQKASVGQLLRWVSRGARLDENTLLITVGRVWYKYPYYFNTFTSKELEDITKSVRLSRRTLIFRTSPDENEYALAEWILSVSGKITGVRLTAKSATSPNAYVRVCPIDLSTCTKSGEIIALSEGGMRSYTPASAYVLPPPIRYGPILNDKQVRPARTNFKTRTSTPALRVILKSMSDPPLEANPNLASTDLDYFEGKISVFNNHPSGSLNPITIASVSAAYRMVGDRDYAPVEACKVVGDSPELPVTIDPKQSCVLSFQVSVPRSEEDKKRNVRWWNLAFCARHRPVRIKLILEDMESEQCSLVLEYVIKPYPFETAKDDVDLGFFFFDDPDVFSRRFVRVQKVSDSDSDGVVSIGDTKLDVKKLNKVVYRALKTGKTEVDLGIGQDKDGEWEWCAYALVDVSCQRVYAFKIILKQGQGTNVPELKDDLNSNSKRLGCMGYALCPAYGDVVLGGKTRAVSYATEVVKLGLGRMPREYIPPVVYVQDDTVDDFRPPVPPKPSTPVLEVPPLTPLGGGGGGVNGNGYGNGYGYGALGMLGMAGASVPPELSNRLASIDVNLGRIADALEMLVAANATASGAGAGAGSR